MAATKKNFSETAKILHLSQPSVSLQMKHLEEYLNTALFDRSTKKIKLTTAGQILFDYAGQIIQLVNVAEKEIALLSDTIHGDLRLGASLTIGEYLLPYYLRDFNKEYPKVNLILKTFNSQQIIDKLINGEIDLGFIEATIPHKDLESIPFLEDELVLISSSKLSNQILHDNGVVEPHLLSSFPFIIREKGSGTRKVLEENLLKNGTDPNKLNIILELENTEAIKSAVESGMGVSIISKTAVQKEHKLGLLNLHQINGLKLTRYFYLLNKKQSLSPGSDLFKDFILNTFQKIT